MAGPSCTNVWDAFPYATEYLTTEFYKKAHQEDMMINLIKRSPFPLNRGITHTGFRYGKQEPLNDEAAWIPVADDTQDSFCGLAPNDYFNGYDAYTYSPESYDLRGVVLCKDEFLYSHEPDQMVGLYLNELEKISRQEYDNRLLKLYMDFSVKMPCNNPFPITNLPGNGWILPQATSRLTQQMLELVAAYLARQGASKPDDNGFITMGPDGVVFPLMISPEASDLLLRNNASTRDDIRYADMGSGLKGSALLKAYGSQRGFRSFRHVPWLFPARFSYANGTYTRVNTWVSVASTKGIRADINPQWITAEYEAAIVLNPFVFEIQPVMPRGAAGLKFGETNHMGEWKWLLGRQNWDVTCTDPWMKFGRHIARYVHAAKPIFPEYGVVLLFNRCKPCVRLEPCNSQPEEEGCS